MVPFILLAGAMTLVPPAVNGAPDAMTSKMDTLFKKYNRLDSPGED